MNCKVCGQEILIKNILENGTTFHKTGPSDKYAMYYVADGFCGCPKYLDIRITVYQDKKG